MSTCPPPYGDHRRRGDADEYRLAALRDRLDSAIRALRTADDWAPWLHAAVRLPGHDVAAVLLIEAQRPGATMVAGYEAWQRSGRQVNKGESGIQILAPGSRHPYPPG